LLGFLCGYRGYRPLADFCVQHEVNLRVLLELAPHQSLPSYSTFRRVSIQVDPQGWIDAFNSWSPTTLPMASATLWSVDGKSIRSTSSGGNTTEQNFISLVSVYAQSLGVLQLRLMQNAQVSELHVARTLLEQLSFLPTGQCFSLDALHTTPDTVKTIVAAQQHYLLAVKQNQPKTHAAIQQLATTETPQSTVSEVVEAHGRWVQRQVQVFPPTAQLQAKWPQLAFVGVVHRSGVRGQKPFEETAYYIGSAPWSAAELLTASRQHWQIENGLHWVKDVTFEEDYPPRRGGHAPVNWAIFNTFAITLARRQGWRTLP
jgi:predicted transposase YbfD/YdcC